MQLLLVTAPPDAAPKIIEPILNEHLAACVNIVHGVLSSYWWEGKITQSGEVLLLIKTRDELVELSGRIHARVVEIARRCLALLRGERGDVHFFLTADAQ